MCSENALINIVIQCGTILLGEIRQMVVKNLFDDIAQAHHGASCSMYQWKKVMYLPIQRYHDTDGQGQ
jgi:hypothetical protein